MAVALAAVTFAGALVSPAAFASDRPLRIVAFGNSLTAGFDLPVDAAFPAKLQRALAAKGVATEIANAGFRATPRPAGSPGSTGPWPRTPRW